MIKVLAATATLLFAASSADAQEQRYLTCSTQYGASPNVTVYVTEVFRYEAALGDKAVADFKSYLTQRYGFKTYANCPSFPNAAEAVNHFEYVQSFALKSKARVSVERWAPDGASTGGATAAASPKPAPAAASAASPAAPKYVEVDGPNGKIRLSPEVAARNQAAADEYRRKMEEHAGNQAEHQRKLALHEQSKAAAAAQQREHERQMAANAAEVAASESAQLEYRKAAAKPAGVNAVFRGFTGPTCEFARRSATHGSGTSVGTRFAEVTQDLSRMPNVCIVQGWWWNTSRTGSSRQ